MRADCQIRLPRSSGYPNICQKCRLIRFAATTTEMLFCHRSFYVGVQMFHKAIKTFRYRRGCLQGGHILSRRSSDKGCCSTRTSKEGASNFLWKQNPKIQLWQIQYGECRGSCRCKSSTFVERQISFEQIFICNEKFVGEKEDDSNIFAQQKSNLLPATR